MCVCVCCVYAYTYIFFKETAKIFSKIAKPFLFLPAMYEGLPIFGIIGLNFPCLLDGNGLLFVVFICIFLDTNDIAHLLMY